MKFNELLDALGDLDGNDGEIAGLRTLAELLWEKIPEEKLSSIEKEFDQILKDAAETRF